MSIRRQCELLGLNRSTWYVKPAAPDAEELALMRRLDEQYLETPFYGSRRMAVALDANRKCIQRLMRVMGIEAIYPKPKLSAAERRTSNLSLFAAEYGHYSAQPGVGQRHHLRADAARLDVLDGGDGLAQPLRVVVAVVEHDRRNVLRGGLERSVGELRQAGNFQHRSGRAVHGRRVHQPFEIGGRGDQHGRPRPLDGQRVRGAIVADVEVRIYLPSRPRHASRVAGRAGGLHPVLQRGTVS